MRKHILILAVLAFLLLACIPAEAAVLDDFNREDSTSLGVGWTEVNHDFQIEAGQVKANHGSANLGYAFIPSGAPSDSYSIHAEVTLSPTYQRAAPGIVGNFRDKKNHLFAKVEVTPKHAGGFLAIGDQVGGKIHSTRCSRSNLGLKNGSTYLLTLTRTGSFVQAWVEQLDGTDIATCSITLSSTQLSAYGGATNAGFRLKIFWDEDDGGSRWDNFSVT